MVKIIPEFKEALISLMETRAFDEKTKTMYLLYYNRFSNIYPELNQRNVDLFLQHNNNSPCRAMIKNLIKAILRWEVSDDIKHQISIIDILPSSSKEEKKTAKFLRKFDVDILEKSIHSGDELKDEGLRLMILIQFYAGLRLNELINLSFNDLNFNKDSYINIKSKDNFQAIRISYKSAKFGKERIAYIPTEIYDRLLSWHKKDILTNYQNKEKANDKSIWHIKITSYKQLLAKWSLKILKKAYNSHSLRHGRGHDLTVNEKKSIEFVKGYLGHASIQSTQIYTHLGNEDIKEELEK